MKWMLLPATALVVVAGCSPASDRGSDTAGTPGRETGMASTDSSTAGGATASAGATTPRDADAAGVLTQLAAANQTEIKQAQVAVKNASEPTVKQFASQLIKDHKASSQQLQQLAKKLGVTLADTGAQATESESASLGELAGKTGKDFDRAFIDAQIQAHEQNIDKIRNQLLPASDQPELRDYLQQTASAMEGHLASAKQLKQDLSSAS